MAKSRGARPLLIAILLAGLVGLVGLSVYRQASTLDRPVEYANDAEHFKYVSIGSDVGGIPD